MPIGKLVEPMPQHAATTLLLATQASAAENSYHVLQYSYVPDILEKRGPFREKHLEGAHKMVRCPACPPVCPPAVLLDSTARCRAASFLH